MPFELPSAPASLTVLDGKAVTIAGYVVPDQTGDGGRLQTALLIKHLLACCFGTTPRLNEWVQLEIAEDAELDFNWRRPARVHGTFEVGPHKTGEIAQALYRIKVQRIVEDPEYGG
jgi:hypothetical protein